MIQKITYLLLAIILSVTCTKHEVIYDGETSEDFSLALILQLDGVDCFYDHPTKTLRYSIAQSNLNNYSPIIQFQESSEVTFEGKKLVNNSPNSLGNLAVNTQYTLEFVVMNEKKTLYLEFTQIPLIQITVKDEIMNEVSIMGKLTMNYPTSAYQSLETFVKIEYRGQSSINNPKKSFGITILSGQDIEKISKVGFFDFGTNNKWALDAMYTDNSKIRNKLSFELWKSLGQTSIESDFVEVFENNESKGLFRLSELYNQNKLGLGSESYLYKGTDNDSHTKFTSHNSKVPKRAAWGSWEQTFPIPSERISWEKFTQLSELIAEGNNAEFIANIGSQLNIDQAIDYYLFVQLCYAFDNAGKNWQFLKQDNFSKFELLLWDVDASWGSDVNGLQNGYRKLVTNNLFTRLMALNPNNFNAKLQSRWIQLRNNQFSEITINKLINDNFGQLETLSIIPKENAIWGKSIHLSTEKNYLKTWVSNRLVFLDTHFN